MSTVFCSTCKWAFYLAIVTYVYSKRLGFSSVLKFMVYFLFYDFVHVQAHVGCFENNLEVYIFV